MRSSTTEEHRLWDIFVAHLRIPACRLELQSAAQSSPADVRAVDAVFARSIKSAARKYANKSSISKFKLRAEALFQHWTAVTCGAGDRPFIAAELPGKGLGIVVTRTFTASRAHLQSQYGLIGEIEVLNADQWARALAARHISLYDDAGFTGILFGPLSLLNDAGAASTLRLAPLSAAEPAIGAGHKKVKQAAEERTVQLTAGAELTLQYGGTYTQKQLLASPATFRNCVGGSVHSSRQRKRKSRQFEG
jgi:hypothetical protein